MRLMIKLACLAFASTLIGACASTPEPIALGERSYRVQALEQASAPRRPDMKQGTRQALRQAALLARRNDADHLRVLDISITESTKQVPGVHNRPMVTGGGLIGALVGELVFAAMASSLPPPPPITLNVRQLELDFEIAAENQAPAVGEEYLGVKQLLKITAPFANDEEQVSGELPPRVQKLLKRALFNIKPAAPEVEPAAEPEANPATKPAVDALVVPDRGPDGSIIETTSN